ncbi:MAG: glycoside hydrolase family 3 C-terminal domain-containing protein [Bacteroidales bacterium]|nr:glycoside hydrolase family 3 C-terminal domain-containing protein [Bacteroidales bacterium]
MKRISLRLIAVLAALTLTLSAFAQLPFQDKTLSPEQRAADIVGRLTLEEKAALLRYDSPAIERLGIPAYNWWNEALHGVARNGNATVYPMPVAMASTFDPQLIEEVFTSVSDEARVKYRLARTVENPDNYWYKGLTFWTPNINIFRDPRWGRGMETYGEDPYLTGQLGMAVVRGLQGDRENGNMKAQACAKHFAVHSGPESTRHSFDVRVSERDLRETYLPAFRDLVVKAKVDEVMFAYNRFEGYPCGASERLLKDILKDEWGFEGLIVSDCWAVSDFFKGHGWSDNPVEAIAAAINAGMDLECGALTPLAVKAVKEGLLDESTIDERLTKLFTVRFALGEMDFESPWDNIPEEVLCSESHSEQALDIARKSLVLLSNDGTLPLKKGAKIGLTGPNAADSVMMWGNYNGFPLRTVTLLDALKARIPDIEFVKGCSHAAELDSTATDIDAVVKEFEDCDIVIFASGISPSLEGEEMPVTIPGFSGGDRTSIELPAIQKQLIAALAQAGKKVVLVNFSGSAIALTDEAKLCNAILQAWYPGQEGGTAIADVLFGDFNPCGKLPVTFYADDSQLPDFDDYAMTGRTYRYFTGTPLYPFGHGLGYSQFKYRKPKVRNTGSGKELVLKLKNKGRMDGDEIVQVYVSRPDDTEGPVKALKAFKRVPVKAGKTVKVVIPLDEETFEWWNPESGRMEYRAGDYILHVGGSSDASVQKTVKVSI